jgi:hypothetical protein
MRARLQDRPGEEAERQRRREEEDEEARRDMLTNAARRDPEPDRGVTSWMQRQLDFSREGEGEELGALERAEKAEIEHAEHHQHDRLLKGGELILSFLAGGEISLASDAAPHQDREPQSDVTDSQTSDSGAASSSDGRSDPQDHAPSISAPLDTRTDGVELLPDVIHDPHRLLGHQRCGFRDDRASHSEMMPPPIPI